MLNLQSTTIFSINIYSKLAKKQKNHYAAYNDLLLELKDNYKNVSKDVLIGISGRITSKGAILKEYINMLLEE